MLYLRALHVFHGRSLELLEFGLHSSSIDSDQHMNWEDVPFW